MDKIKALKYFKRVAELDSFTAAAKTFNVPASSISRRINDLEESLGVELLKRTTRNVHLTELGSIYYEMVSELLSGLEQADALVSQRIEAPSGTLRISSMPYYGEEVLSPILSEFQDLYPMITLDLDYSDKLAVFNQNNIDIAIRGGYLSDERVIAKRLASNEFKLVASPEFIQPYGGAKLSLADIEAAAVLQYRGPSGLISWYAKTANHWQEIQLKPRLVTNSAKTLLDATIKGRGLACVPYWGVKRQLDSGELIEVATDLRVNVSQDRDIGIFMLHQQSKYQIPTIKLCVDFLLKKLAI